MLVFNIHGSRRSVLVLTSAYRQLRGWPPLGMMSPAEVAELIAASGLVIHGVSGWGILPRRLYRSPLRRVIAKADRGLSRVPGARYFAQDLIYICRRTPQSGQRS